jgi:hypothetical protein
MGRALQQRRGAGGDVSLWCGLDRNDRATAINMQLLSVLRETV